MFLFYMNFFKKSFNISIFKLWMRTKFILFIKMTLKYGILLKKPIPIIGKGKKCYVLT